jgi:protein-S-isoprenylcysteine O-methyltransferase Ste14
MATKAASRARLFLALIYVLIFPAVLLLLGGDWRWPQSWIFCAWFLALCWVTIVFLYRTNPALLAERFKRPGSAGQKGWDRYLVAGLILLFVVWLVVMPLDTRRFGWSHAFPLASQIAGGLALLLSAFLFFRAYADNSFLSPLVRIQTERHQQVVSKGVYAVVRHPMYLAGIFFFFGAPLLLGSRWGIAAAFALSVILVVRIAGEERMLERELDGYRDYQRKVRYRLLPFIW